MESSMAAKRHSQSQAEAEVPLLLPTESEFVKFGNLPFTTFTFVSNGWNSSSWLAKAGIDEVELLANLVLVNLLIEIGPRVG
jgi:hypothetical protein